VGNFVNPPLMVSPAGLRLVSGALAHPNVSALAEDTKLNVEMAIAIAVIIERIFIISLFISMENYLMVIGI
jgi:hypothetical protein